MRIETVHLITDATCDVTAIYIRDDAAREYGYLYKGVRSGDDPEVQAFLQDFATRYNLPLHTLTGNIIHWEPTRVTTASNRECQILPLG